ncbi:methyl-accepting chemotaxis protein [Pseudodesulfovibrio sediminis]|uniref:Methyl-accepting transducer domain-containing protein n=1 Tax=Pseudodesulfovibrio sediminis TaxID=2810563 RepID=A0ABN6ELS6_9BACT|nr:methyl-accepting chemotaxis protein [Pseudodesulfovibrio sediminis]BCS86972.1 hypothetical protein PSDVSF_02140 [Pseudodesulfovibrio sediminis]
MVVRPLSTLIALGLFLCCIFAGATYVGGWLAYSIGAGCTLGATLIVGVLFRKELRQIADILASLTQGESREISDAMIAGKIGEGLTSCRIAVGEMAAQVFFFKAAVHELGTPVMICNEKGVVVLATKSMLELLQKTEGQVVGKSVSEALYNKTGTSLTERALRNRRGLVDARDLVLWDGRSLAVELAISIFKDASGKVIGAATSVIDMTERVERQKLVEQQSAQMISAGERLSKLAEHVASATELLSASADDQAQGAQKQSAQTASVATAMEEMTETVLEVAQNATATRKAADEAHESAAEGVDMVNKAVAAINQVAESARQLEHEVKELDSQADAIGQIISVINDIADQTNLLALNAAIEAARAGEAGRGFAVVADEVRKLAEKTMDATKDVEKAISMIQSSSRYATTSMQATARQVDESTELSNQAGEALQHIMSSIKDMVSRVGDIATASGEQSVAAEEVMHNVEEIASIAGDADEAAGQAASATRDMAELAKDLLTVSKEFLDHDGDIEEHASDTKMKGVLLKYAQEYVKDTYDSAVYQAMQEGLGNPVFLPTDSYPDQYLMRIAELTSRAAGVSVRDFFLDLGRFTVVKFKGMYPRYFKEESLKSFYLRMNDVHAHLTKDQPGIKPPNFTYEDKGDELFMNYRSKRGLFDYFEGILLGAAEAKGERVSVKIKPFDAESARAEIVFHGKIV